MNTHVRKVGRITVAVGLIALGAALLMDNLLGAGPGYTSLVLRYWPVLLIGFGLEYLVFSLVDGEDSPPVRLRFDIGGAFLLFLIVGLTAGFHTVSRWLPNPWISVSATPASRSESRSIDATEAEAVVIDVDTGRVELYAQRLNEVRVEAAYDAHSLIQLGDSGGEIDQFELDLVEDDGVITLTAGAPSGLKIGSMATYRVYVPSGLKVRVGTGAGSVVVREYEGDLTLKSKLGTILVETAAGRLDAETGSGTIQIRQFTGPVAARTSAGGITVRHVTGPLALDSGTGMITVNDYAGDRLVAETRTGSIQVETPTPLEGDVLLKTSAGAITLRVPRTSSMKVTAQTKTGSIQAPGWVTVTRSGTSQSGTGTAGAGQHMVTLEASMGSIHFTTP